MVIKSVVALLSGGLDSVVSMATLLDEYKIQKALLFDYGQRAFEKELSAVEKVCGHYKIPFDVVVLPWLKAITETSLVNTSSGLPRYTQQNLDTSLQAIQDSAKAVWVPNRNGVMLNIAAAFAESLNCKYLVFGANAEEATTFPDNTKEYADQLTKAFSYSTANHVTILAPLSGITKTEIVALAIEKKVPLQYVWSCYMSEEKHCGTCESCARLQRALCASGQESLWKEIASV